MFNPDEIYALKLKLNTPKKIVLVPHQNPDGDAVGSTLGLSHVLKKLGHETTIVSPNDFPKFLKWLPEAKKIFNASFNPKGAEIIFHQAEVIFLLDFNDPSRADQLEPLIQNSNAVKVLIDHHQFPTEVDFTYSDVSMPATCEMIWHFIVAMDWVNLVDKDVATCLYTGMLTDTGNFKFASVKPSTLETAGQLVRHGAEPFRILDNLDSYTESRLRLLSNCLDNMQIFPKFRTTLFYLSKDELLANGFQKGDTEGFVNYGLGINDIVFSVFMADDTQRDMVKISFRSKGNFDCSEVASEHFSGGGHVNASGGKSNLSLEETIKEFVNLLPTYAEKLENTVV